MNARTLPATSILAAGVGWGFAGDYLMRAPGAPGLNLALLVAGLAVSVGVVSLNGGPRLSREARIWLAVGMILGTGLLWRGSGLLRFLAFMSAATAFAFPALQAGGAWIRRAGVTDLLEAVSAAGFHAVLGSGRLLQEGRWNVVASDDSQRTARSVARSVVIGVLLAAVPLGIFGALFLSADPVFAGILSDIVKIDLGAFLSHVALISVLSWLACGYLSGFVTGTRLKGLRALGWEAPSLRTGEVAIALGLVNLLFLGFVVVQFRYLFGGAEMVEVTPGLTYAAYAREGFFQLVAATALGLPWLLAADGLVGEREGSARWTFRALAGTQLVLLLAIAASATRRLRAYLDAYGLTEDRFVAMAVLVWLAALVIWFAATVLRGRRSPFAFGAVVSGLGLIAFLHLANPTGRAVHSHLDRAGAAGVLESDAGSALDVAYLASLGSDAAPVLIGRIDGLAGAARCEVAAALLDRWGPDGERDWRSWNLADWRARQLVREGADRLRTMVEADGGCG